MTFELYFQHVSEFHKVTINIEVSALLDGGFKPSAMIVYYGYSPDFIKKIQQLKKEGKSLVPNFVRGIGGRSKWGQEWGQGLCHHFLRSQCPVGPINKINDFSKHFIKVPPKYNSGIFSLECV